MSLVQVSTLSVSASNNMATRKLWRGRRRAAIQLLNKALDRIHDTDQRELARVTSGGVNPVYFANDGDGPLNSAITVLLNRAAVQLAAMGG